MSKATEDVAVKFLLKRFEHPHYSFERPDFKDGFDLWLVDNRKSRRRRAELKSTNGKFRSESSIRQNLVLNHKKQADSFKKGRMVLVRVFLGNKPHKVVIVPRTVLGKHGRVKRQNRYELRGKLNYRKIEIVER